MNLKHKQWLAGQVIHAVANYVEMQDEDEKFTPGELQKIAAAEQT